MTKFEKKIFGKISKSQIFEKFSKFFEWKKTSMAHMIENRLKRENNATCGTQSVGRCAAYREGAGEGGGSKGADRCSQNYLKIMKPLQLACPRPGVYVCAFPGRIWPFLRFLSFQRFFGIYQNLEKSNFGGIGWSNIAQKQQIILFSSKLSILSYFEFFDYSKLAKVH